MLMHVLQLLFHFSTTVAGAVLAQKFWGRWHCLTSPFITEPVLTVLRNRKHTNAIWAYIFQLAVESGGNKCPLSPKVEPPQCDGITVALT